jgi:hypothetical protein
MILLFEPRPRMPRVPLWAFALVAVWLALVGVIQWLGQRLAEAPIICHLRLFTGIPCPTCGTTRAFLALLDGRPLDALLLNPLMVVLGIAVGVIVGLRVIAGRQLVVHFSARQLPWLWVFAVVIFLLNWAYVIAQHQHMGL